MHSSLRFYSGPTQRHQEEVGESYTSIVLSYNTSLRSLFPIACSALEEELANNKTLRDSVLTRYRLLSLPPLHFLL